MLLRNHTNSVPMQKFSKLTATSIVIANMVGTGVFTSLGFQLLGIESHFALLMLWLVGGITALCGALTYAELGANLPRSGGEYNFLGRLYHPSAGFISGWVSATVGFAAPVALAAMTFGAYLNSAVPQLPATGSALSLVATLTAVHSFSRQASSGVQQTFTVLKIAVILIFCAAVLSWGNSPQTLSITPQSEDVTVIFSGAFAVSLIYVNYAYTGWNAVTYVTGELEKPQQSLPVVLLLGTVTVMLLYLLLNYTFLASAPTEALRGELEIGVISATSAFGDHAGKLMGVILAVLLISTVSAMTMAGPRVLQMIGQDFRVFKVLSRENSRGIPSVAIIFQSVLAVTFTLSSTFESVLIFSSFVLAINTLFSVIGVFILRHKKLGIGGAYKTFGYPWVPLIYLSVTLWTLSYVLFSRPQEALVGLGLIAVGGIIYQLSMKKQQDSGRV